MVVSLIHDAQEIAILEGRESLNLETLNEAYQKRLSLLHSFISPKTKRQTSKTKKKTPKLSKPESLSEEYSIADLVATAKGEEKDVVEFLKNYITVVEVGI